jgi:molybdate transport system substrate-binding protein
MRLSSALRVAALGLSAVALAACSSSSSPSSSGSPASGSSGAASGAITVFAASSLKEAFTTIGKQFEAANPGAKVTFNFGPSSTLATQITQGAPADVFAAASTKAMDTVVSGGAASGPQTFATNTMEIATPAKPTVAVTSLADLAKPSVKVAVCQKDVPCGVAADKLFTQNNLAVTPVSQEVDVKAVLAKVTLGEVDAGIVYVTDVKAAGDKVVGVTIPADQNVTTKYPIAAVTASSQGATAAAFVAYVLSPAGQQVLATAGFAAP